MELRRDPQSGRPLGHGLNGTTLLRSANPIHILCVLGVQRLGELGIAGSQVAPTLLLSNIFPVAPVLALRLHLRLHVHIHIHIRLPRSLSIGSSIGIGIGIDADFRVLIRGERANNLKCCNAINVFQAGDDFAQSQGCWTFLSRLAAGETVLVRLFELMGQGKRSFSERPVVRGLLATPCRLKLPELRRRHRARKLEQQVTRHLPFLRFRSRRASCLNVVSE